MMALARRAPLLRKTPLRTAKAIAHSVFPGPSKRRPATTAVERRHLGLVAGLGCCVPECGAPATVHHVTSDGHQRLTRTHERVVPLCPTHHMVQFGPRESVEALGHAGFTARYGIDLLALSKRLWAQSQLIEKGHA